MSHLVYVQITHKSCPTHTHTKKKLKTMCWWGETETNEWCIIYLCRVGRIGHNNLYIIFVVTSFHTSKFVSLDILIWWSIDRLFLVNGIGNILLVLTSSRVSVSLGIQILMLSIIEAIHRMWDNTDIHAIEPSKIMEWWNKTKQNWVAFTNIIK